MLAHRKVRFHDTVTTGEREREPTRGSGNRYRDFGHADAGAKQLEALLAAART